MYPFAHYEFMQARVAELRRQAERDRRAHAAITDRRAQRRRNGQPGYTVRRPRPDVAGQEPSSRPRYLRWLRLPGSVRSTEVAKFMDVHSGFIGVTEDQLREAHERDLDVEAAESVHFEHAWLDPESGRVFCLSTGPSKEAVQRVHEKAGHPADEIYELPVEVE